MMMKSKVADLEHLSSHRKMSSGQTLDTDAMVSIYKGVRLCLGIRVKMNFQAENSLFFGKHTLILQFKHAYTSKLALKIWNYVYQQATNNPTFRINFYENFYKVQYWIKKSDYGCKVIKYLTISTEKLPSTPQIIQPLVLLGNFIYYYL